MTRNGIESMRDREEPMQSHLKLLHRWSHQMEAILVGVRVTRVRGLSLLVMGILLSRRVSLPAVAAAVPGRARDESRIKRLQRWLANPAVKVEEMWPLIRRALLHDVVGRKLILVFDPTPQAGHTTVLVLGLLRHKRVLPLAWRLVPQQADWDERMAPLLGAMAAEVAADLPVGCHITVLADRGITGPATIRVLRALGWHIVFRLNVGPKQTNRVQVAGDEWRLWDWITTHGWQWSGPVDLFKDAGWMRLELTVVWDRRFAEPWILISDEPAGAARVRAYRRRTAIEATFADTKRRGFDFERTKIIDHDRLDRLLLGLAIALWWATQLGLRVIRVGRRTAYDRSDRRDRSVLHLGTRELYERLIYQRCPALPFSKRNGVWRFALYS